MLIIKWPPESMQWIMAQVETANFKRFHGISCGAANSEGHKTLLRRDGDVAI